MSLRNLLWAIPLALVLMAPFWHGRAADFLRVDSEYPDDAAPPQTSIELRRVVISQAKAGRDELWLTADRLYSRRNQQVYILENADARLAGGGGGPVTVKSGSASYDTGKQILTLLDNVDVVTPDQFHLSTSVMRYLVKFGVLKSAAAVDLSGDGVRVAGTSFSYGLRTGNIRVGGRVRCDLW